jgi:hypothetical protein
VSDRNPDRDCLHGEKLGDYYDKHELWDEDEEESAEVESDQDAVFTIVSDC